MTKRAQHIESVDLGSDDDFTAAVHGTLSDDGVFTIEQVTVVEPSPLQRLIDSGIVVAAEGAISWREGHLEHIAALYAADARQTWRDYADDLTVALAADGSAFAAAVERARGNAE